MAKFDFDLFVIGAGSGGVRAARMSAGFGARVAVAEERYLGGTCVNVGCVPKKLFVYAAHYGEDFVDADGFGWQAVDGAEFKWNRLLNNKDREIERLHKVYERLLSDAGVQLFQRRATLVDAHTVAVGDASYTAERLLIATGGWPIIPEFPGREHVITSNEVFSLERFPERCIIVGGGYIAVEFAGIFVGLGADVSLIYRGPLFLRGFDDEVRGFLAEEMRKKEIALRFNTNVTEIRRSGNGLTVLLTNGEKIETDLVMYATGRAPMTAGLGLEKIGVALSDNGAVVVNSKFQSSVGSIYAIGDVTDRIRLTPVALAEGMVLAREVYGDTTSAVDYDCVPSAVFSQPSIGTVGLTETEARKRFPQVEVYKSVFTPLRHSLSGSDEKTLMKLIVDRETDKVVGAHMVGPEAGEIIQGVAVAMRAGATKACFDSTIGIHPTTAEEFVTMRDPVV